MLNFLRENWYLLLMAGGSAALLFVPGLNRSDRGNNQGISPNRAVILMNREKAKIVDISDAQTFAQGHIGGAKSLAAAAFETQLASVFKNKKLPLILVCANGAQSNKALAKAQKLGFESVFVLAGGMQAWRAENLPIEKSL